MNWQDVNRLARNLAPLEEWRNDIAQRLRVLTRSDMTGVATCSPGHWTTSLSINAYPHDFTPLWEQGARYFPPRLEQAGQGWR